MALRAVHVSDVPNLDQVPENAAFSLFRSSPLSAVVNGEDEEMKSGFKFGKFMVVGHRGSGMNMLHSSYGRMKSIKENSILSFNSASKLRLDFIEFDVQWLFGSAIEMDTRGLFIPAVCGKRSAYMQRPLTVTKDDCPVIFHDNFILTEDKGAIIEKRTTEIALAEFLSYGPHKEAGKLGKPLFRKTRDGRIFEWKVENDDPLCTLEEVFQKVEHSMGFNIELKFDDQIVYKEEELTHLLQVILNVVNEYAKDRPIIFSTFQPDASLLIRKLQNTYPVFFLTNGGSEIYADIRRNSLDEAIKLCLSGGLQGIVSEVKAVFRNPGAVTRIKESKLALITYGQLNNVPEVVYMQHLMGVEGVIVDLVQEIKEAVLDYLSPAKDDEEDNIVTEKKDIMQVKTKPQFSQLELSFLLKLIPELISH